MGSSPRARRLFYGSLYGLLCAVILLVHILPTDFGPDGMPGPDLLLCITFAWVLRRPHYLPPLLVAAVFLLADILFMRPPGLWAALVLIAVEYLRAREPILRDLPIATEFATVGAAILFVPVAYQIVLVLVAVPQAGFGLLALQTIATLITYPMLVILARVILKVDRMSPTEAEAARLQ